MALTCSAQSTSQALKAVKGFRINFCWKFRVLSVSLKLFLPLLFELNGPTRQHNLNAGALVLLQRAQLMLPFIVLCVCVGVLKTQNKNICSFLWGAEWPSIYRSPSIQTRTIYLGFSDFSHSARSGFKLAIHKDVMRARFLNSTVSNILQTALSVPWNWGLPDKMVLSPSRFRQ